MALNQRSLAIATLLLENGADVNKKSTTPLYVQITFMLDNYRQIGKNQNYQETMNDCIKLLKIANDKKSG